MTGNGPSTSLPGPQYTVAVRGLVVMCSIGIDPREHETKQRVRVSVDLVAVAGAAFPGDDRHRIIRYDRIVASVRAIAGAGHIDLCEGLAERICGACLADPRVARVRVRVEKLDVFDDVDSVGVILERDRDDA